MQPIIPIPPLPAFRQRSPDVVRILDRIRTELDADDSYAEFCWFAREYPRVFRHHIDHAEHRLKLIHAGYSESHESFTRKILKADANALGFGAGGIGVMRIHWDFEAYLNCIGSALDVLARIVGIGSQHQVPISFTGLCRSKAQGELVGALRGAQSRWVTRLKDYRDCFVHYTPIETLLVISCNQYDDGWETRLKLPVNPNSRDILLFRYSRRCHVLKYAIAVYRHLVALDRKVARLMAAQYAVGVFPARIHNLFFVGARRR